MDPITRHEVLEKDRDRLKQMTYYCTTTDCLRAHMLRYFGEQSPNFAEIVPIAMQIQKKLILLLMHRKLCHVLSEPENDLVC
ncbi:MAG: RecQ family zinc-binding domain-containing protein [Acutalibacteraceae bacterium]